MSALRVPNLSDQLLVVVRALRRRSYAALSPLRETESNSHIIVVA
jgi:hypothetical protein